ncbi:MAG: DUF692 domain-containing protein [Pseudomonadota bacterium]
MANPKNSIPSSPKETVGIGLRHPYYEEILDTDLNIGWIEVHPENFFGGGTPRHFLKKAREKFDLSLHAVGLSLGSTEPVNQNHLASFKKLIDEFEPFNISDHASWSASGNAHLNDLLPLPYTQESLDTLCRNIDTAQKYFGRTMCIENPSTYIAFAENDMSEAEFMNKLAEETGCSLLLDINNIYVQCENHGYDAKEYIDTIDGEKVAEMHLAGHTEHKLDNGEIILIDSHNRHVRDEVWALFEYTLKKLTGDKAKPVPTLIEWDQDFPGLNTLVTEADKARALISKIYEGPTHVAA